MKLDLVYSILGFLSVAVQGAAVTGIFDHFPGNSLTLEIVASMPIPKNAQEILVYSSESKVPLEVVNYVLANWPVNVNRLDKVHMSAIDYAICDCNIPIVRALIQNGAIIFESSLMRAVDSGNLELVMLIQKNSFVLDDKYCCSVTLAAGRGQAAIVSYLLEARPHFDVNSLNLKGETPLIAAASFPGDNREVLGMLLARNANLFGVDSLNQNCLFKAVQTIDADKQFFNLKYLLEAAGDEAYHLMILKDNSDAAVIDFLNYEHPEHVWRLMQEIEEQYYEKIKEIEY